MRHRGRESGRLVLLLAVTLTNSAAGQGTPSQAVDSAFAAFARRDWPTVAELVNPTALDSLRQESLGLIILMAENRLAGREETGYNPGEVVIADHVPRVGSERVPQFPGNPTIAELASLSPTQFFIAWCGTVFRTDSGNDPMREVVSLQRRIIGEVQEGDSIAHVVYRRESRQIDMGELFIDLPGRMVEMPLKRVSDRWTLLLNDDIGWTVNFMEALGPEPRYRTQPLKRTVRQHPPPESTRSLGVARERPEQTVRAGFAALKRHDWQSLAATVDPNRLRSFQRAELAYLIAWTHSKESRAQAARQGINIFILSYDDDSLSPETIAQVANVKIPIIPNSPTIGELAQLTPSDFFARWCEGAYRPDSEDKGQGLADMPREVVGAVFESETRAYVLYRYGTPRRLESVDLMPVNRIGDGWGILLNEDIGDPSLFALRLNSP